MSSSPALFSFPALKLTLQNALNLAGGTHSTTPVLNTRKSVEPKCWRNGRSKTTYTEYREVAGW